MTILILGLVLFIGTHAFTMPRGRRAALIARLGEGPYKGGYSILTAIGFVLLVYGYHVYRADGMIPVWSPPVWTRHLAVLLNLFAFISLGAMGPRPSHLQAALKHPVPPRVLPQLRHPLVGIQLTRTRLRRLQQHLTPGQDVALAQRLQVRRPHFA